MIVKYYLIASVKIINKLCLLFKNNLLFYLQLGMRNYHLRKNTKWCPALNLDKLWTLVSEQTRLKYKDATPEGKVPVIDLVRAVRVFKTF
jgi:hypothetical protein